MEVSYDKIMNAIIKGLLDNNENQIIGQMLLQTEYSIDQLISNDEAAFSKIYSYLTPTAFSVLQSLKNEMNDDFVLLDEEGKVLDISE